MLRLGVNIDHIATVREARQTIEPDPVTGALIAELAGADGITCHLREDRRHIKDRDVEVLRKTVKTMLNLECSATMHMVEHSIKYSPDQVTLVPEKREEVTTEGGLNVIDNLDDITAQVKLLKSNGISVALFLDPDKKQIDAGCKTGADAIEIHTGAYANSTGNQQEEELLKIEEMAMYINKRKLKAHAGHGLNYTNTQDIAAIPSIEELNIGHSIISKSIMVGITEAVKDMKDLMIKSRGEL